ncbi:protein THYLAKOID ASSEMBLY 8, chloroplastic [Telopea speciosissima]|uniref:protein THYLAKOID ASSEMBLY 8, chloroplastic n=1 Tax=Telopea speciosissima TaxID=54955 RepID=UPI001CC34563|nr:protein THYLAKOID ASSEMBLY 8, chloroplastic [Telopea speciosissima]
MYMRVMASSLRLNHSCFSPSYSSPTPKPHRNCVAIIRCGPRDNRGPLHRGRILSIEAIQAVQALKRAERVNETQIDEFVSKTLSRLIKQDLLASLKELLRQDRCHLALKVFEAARSELWYKTDCSLYADMVTALARTGMIEEIDRLISVDLERDGLGASEERGLSRLVKALIAAERTESVVRVYGLMKRCGWVSASASASASATDEYVVKILSRGLRRLGEERVADEVEMELMSSVPKGKLDELRA